MHNVARFMVFLTKSIASSPKAIVESSFSCTFSNETSAHDCPSTVEKELIDTPLVSESRITILYSLSVEHVTTNLLEFAPFRTKVLVPLRIFLESNVVSQEK